jgi:uncharacterized protein (TIGR00730 family)
MRLCVFLGSSSGVDQVYAQAAYSLGRAMAQRGVGMVYGGASVGLMGAAADAALAFGAEVIGVIPQALFEHEVGHKGLSELKIVSTMHERKAMMAQLSDGFIALPGGIGTFEELFEIWTWAQLGYHHKPCAILNVNGYYDQLIDFLDHTVAQGFLKPAHRGLLIVESEVEKLMERILAVSGSN